MTNQESERKLEDRLQRLQPPPLSAEFEDRLLGIDQNPSSAEPAFEVNIAPRTPSTRNTYPVVICVALVLLILTLAVSWWVMRADSPSMVDQEPNQPQIAQTELNSSFRPTLVNFNVALKQGGNLTKILEDQSESLLPEFSLFTPYASSEPSQLKQ